MVALVFAASFASPALTPLPFPLISDGAPIIFPSVVAFVFIVAFVAVAFVFVVAFVAAALPVVPNPSKMFLPIRIRRNRGRHDILRRGLAITTVVRPLVTEHCGRGNVRSRVGGKLARTEKTDPIAE